MSACTSDDGSSQVVVADSLGIRTVSYSSLPGDVPQWQLSADPVVTIGVTTGSEVYQFSRIRDVAPVASGLVVADGHSAELRSFDAQGRIAARAGGPGSGPGEFQALAWMGTFRDDSVMAWDLRLQRISIFDRQMNLARTADLRLNVPVYIVVGVFENGTVLTWPFGISRRIIASPQVVQDTNYFAVVGLDHTEDIDTIVRAPARPMYMEPDGSQTPLPFTVEPGYAIAEDKVWAGNGGTMGELRRHTINGQHDLVIRPPVGPPVTPAMIQAYRAASLENYQGPERAQREQILDRMPQPATLPSFDQIHVDEGNNLWVRQYLAANAETQSWMIFNDIGELIATATVPRRLRVMAITDDRVIGVFRDDFDVEHIWTYGLTRTAQ